MINALCHPSTLATRQGPRQMGLRLLYRAFIALSIPGEPADSALDLVIDQHIVNIN